MSSDDFLFEVSIAVVGEFIAAIATLADSAAPLQLDIERDAALGTVFYVDVTL